MNRYPAWLNLLVLAIFLLGTFLALPNIYGSVDAVQLADKNGVAFDEQRVEVVVAALEPAGITPQNAYLQQGRVVVTFEDVDQQKTAADIFRERFSDDSNVAITLAPDLPDWVRELGLSPMSLGLDLRGGVYVLLEVDMETAIEGRLAAYEQDFTERLRDEGIRTQVRLSGATINIRLQSADEMETARDIIREADADLVILIYLLLKRFV